MSGPAWIDFWDAQHALGRSHFDWTARVFMERASTVLAIRESDIVLDFGCGPGSLALLLRERVAEVTCVETSRRMVAECRARFAGRPGLSAHLIPRDRNADLSRIPGGPFTLILCQSVAQYFEDRDELERVIGSVRVVAAPGARMLVSDLPAGDSFLPSLATQALEGLRCRRPGLRLDHALCLAGGYRRIRSARGLRLYPAADLLALAGRLGLDAEVIHDRLTVNGGRLHLLVRF